MEVFFYSFWEVRLGENQIVVCTFGVQSFVYL